MRTRFTALDDALIEHLFQPLSDFTDRRFGLGVGRAACVCLDIASVGWILARAQAVSDAVVTRDAGETSLHLAILLMGLLALISLRILFRRAGGKPAANPLRLSMRPHRAVVVLMLATRGVQSSVTTAGWAAPGEFADLAMLVFVTMSLYFGACTERPPVRRAWFGHGGAGARSQPRSDEAVG